MAGSASSWRPDVGTGFGVTWPRARPTPLSTEPRRWRSRPASRYGSLRASAAAAFCPAGDGNGQKRRLRMVLSVSATCQRMGRIRGAGRAKPPAHGGPGGFLEIWELIWEGLFGSAWQGGRDWGFVASRRSGPRYLGGQKKTPVVFTGAWFLEKIRGRAGGLTGLVRDHSPRNRRSSDSNSAT